VISLCAPEKKIVDLCQAGDQFIQEACSTVYNKGKISKGIAFPTCVCINSAICHLSPLISDPEANWTLANGDAVRIELGVHIDGYFLKN
jgi:methionine aminopeptidase